MLSSSNTKSNSVGTSSSTTTTLSRQKPNPLPMPIPTITSQPISSPTTKGMLSSRYTLLSGPGGTPVMLHSPSPVPGPGSNTGCARTPIMPLDFWTTYSPVATLSPRGTPAATTTGMHFQFPSFMALHSPGIALSPFAKFGQSEDSCHMCHPNISCALRKNQPKVAEMELSCRMEVGMKYQNILKSFDSADKSRRCI